MARCLALAMLALLAACGNERELWSDASPADQVPGFSQVSPPDLNAVAASADGAVVAVGDNGVVLRSTDRGRHWNTVPAGATGRTLRHVVAAPDGSLVAVGEHGSIVRSSNGGATWSAVADTGTDKTLHRVLALSPAVLLAVGDDATIVRSADGGETWSAVYGSDSVTLWQLVAADARTLFAVGDAGVIVTSGDGGESWTPLERRGSRLRSVLATRSGALVVAGDGIMRADHKAAPLAEASIPMTSASGYESMPFTQLVETRAGTLVALGPGRKPQYSRDDGRSWGAATLPAPYAGADLALVAADGALASIGLATAMRSLDGGVVWTAGTAPKAGASLNAATVLPGGVLVAVGRAGTILRSEDGGASWRSVRPAGRTERLLSVAAGGTGVLVAVGEGGSIMRSTNHGQSWAAVSDTGTDETLRRVLAQPTRPWIAVSMNSSILVSPTGGQTWLPARWPVRNHELRDILAAGPPGTLVAVGYGGTVLRSENGGWDWTLAPRVTDKTLNRVIAHRQVLVAVGDDGTVLRSTDLGKTWRPAANSNTLLSIIDIASSGDALVAIGPDDMVLRSTDLGNNFVPVAVKASALESIVAGRNGTLVALGTRHGINPGIMMLRSTDSGSSWTVVPMESVSTMPLGKIIVQPGGVMLGLGGRPLRSIDDGATWSALADTPFRAGQNDGVLARDGRFVAVGEEGVIIRESARRTAPAIRSVVHSYDLRKNPVLRLSMTDPDKLCPGGACISAWARTQLDMEKGKAGDRQPPVRLLDSAGGTERYELRLDPRLAVANQPASLHVNFVVDVPGHHRLYQDKPGVDFVVPNNPTPLWEETWFRALATVVLAMLSLCAISLYRPLWLLWLLKAQDQLANHGIADWSGQLLTVIVRYVIPWLGTRPRVLDAWVEKHAVRLAIAFKESAKRVSDTSPYWALPVTGPNGTHMIPSPEKLAPFFAPNRVFIEIVGQGGAGKTRLALQICDWLDRMALLPWKVQAVLVDEEFDDILAVVDGKLKTALGKDAPVEWFLKTLLAQGRLGILVDRVSERRQATQLAVTRTYEKMSPKILICTSRTRVQLHGVAPTLLMPEPIGRKALEGFVHLQLQEAQAQDLFPDIEPLLGMINDMAPHAPGRPDLPRVTPLLVTIVMKQVIESARAHGGLVLRDIPQTVPDMYFSYVERLDETRQDLPNVRGVAPGALIRSAASIIACAELGEDFRPKRVDEALVHHALMADPHIEASAIDFIDRFTQNGLLSRRMVGAVSTVEFLLDPLAECLAAHQHAIECGNSQERWEALVQRVASFGEGTQGFMAALRMNHEAYARARKFPPVAFPLAGGLS